MARENLGNMFPLIFPTNSLFTLCTKWLRDVEHESISQLWRRVRESTLGCRTSSLRAREGVRDPTIPIEARGPPTQPMGGIRILEGGGDRL